MNKCVCACNNLPSIYWIIKQYHHYNYECCYIDYCIVKNLFSIITIVSLSIIDSKTCGSETLQVIIIQQSAQQSVTKIEFEDGAGSSVGVSLV